VRSDGELGLLNDELVRVVSILVRAILSSDSQRKGVSWSTEAQVINRGSVAKLQVDNEKLPSASQFLAN